jgi:toxin ParE1/3/4
LSLFELSPAAWSDVQGIVEYTLEKWGPDQAERYIDRLDAAFRLLADTPLIGVPSGRLAPGLRRLAVEHHVVFYLPLRKSIRIIRVLHERQLPRQHQFLDE